MRFLSTLALAGLFGALLLTSDASACHKKAVCAAPCPPPAPVCEPAPAPVCEAPAKKCHFKMPKLKFGCHKKAVCEPVCATVEYAAPVYAAPQASPQASGQASGQGM